MKKIEAIVCTTDLSQIDYVINARSNGVKCITVIDPRSAVYLATGICAQNRNPVLVFINGSNASRSAFSGMTEAYYRNLPVLLVTIGRMLDYSRELADVSYGHYVVSKVSEVEKFLDNRLPLHIEVNCSYNMAEKEICHALGKLLESALEEEDYLYVSQGVQLDGTFKCKIVLGGMPNCFEGALANVLGASLSKRHRKYIGVVSEEEMKHDINTLGNININSRILFINVCRKKNKFILDYANSMGYSVFYINREKLNHDYLHEAISNENKSFLMIYREG